MTRAAKKPLAGFVEGSSYNPSEDVHGGWVLSNCTDSVGGARPAEDVPWPLPDIYSSSSASTAEALFIADLLAQFSKLLKLKPVPFQELLRLTKGNFNPKAESQEPFWDLYLGLLSQTKKVGLSFFAMQEALLCASVQTF